MDIFPILEDLDSIITRQKKRKGGGTGDPESASGWDWGWRVHPILKTRKWHNGVDLPASIGTPIFAPWDGSVVRAWTDSLNGNAMRIRHPSTPGVSETAYAHLDDFASGIKSGSKVKAGDIIGFVGTTGRSTGPHLHFIIRGSHKQMVCGKMRRDIDPLRFLSQKKIP